MTRNASAYHVLGLTPDADAQAVDRAYRMLIKRFHPDRAGGDAARAAEINGAYDELRKEAGYAADKRSGEDFSAAIYAGWAGRRRRVRRKSTKSRLRPLLLATTLAFACLAAGLFQAGKDGVAEPGRVGRPIIGPMSVPPSAQLPSPLHMPEIDAAVRAAGMLNKRDEGLLIEESRACHRRLRQSPTLSLLDRCAAFDDAVLEIRNRNPVVDSGGFSAPAVTARQMAAAKLLSNDYVEIEGRLDRVRARVRNVIVGGDRARGASGVSQAAPGASGGLTPLVRGSDRPASH